MSKRGSTFKGRPSVNAYAKSVGRRKPRDSTVMSYDQLENRIVALEQANRTLKDQNRQLHAGREENESGMSADLYDIARVIWRETYRRDSQLEWHEVRVGTMHYKRVVAAAEAARAIIIDSEPAGRKTI